MGRCQRELPSGFQLSLPRTGTKRWAVDVLACFGGISGGQLKVC